MLKCGTHKNAVYYCVHITLNEPCSVKTRLINIDFKWRRNWRHKVNMVVLCFMHKLQSVKTAVSCWAYSHESSSESFAGCKVTRLHQHHKKSPPLCLSSRPCSTTSHVTLYNSKVFRGGGSVAVGQDTIARQELSEFFQAVCVIAGIEQLNIHGA